MWPVCENHFCNSGPPVASIRNGKPTNISKRHNNHATGGTCYGDSGGPNFIGDSNVIGGVTSFINNDNCAGTGGVFRLDRQSVLDFVNDFLQ